MINNDDLYYIDLVKHGDTSAYSYLVERYSDMVYSLALKILKNEADAEDMAQEIFIAAYTSLQNFKGDSKFSTWLYRITYNRTISKLRKTQRVLITENERFLEGLSDAEFIKFEPNDQEVAVEQLQQAISNLTEEEQLLIMLHYFHEQSVEDISKVTMLSESNVKVKLFRIRKKLKTMVVQNSEPSIPVIR